MEIDLNEIVSVESIEIDTVYDITVQQTHCYYLENEILVHNSGKSFGTMQVLISIAIDSPFERISVVSHSLPHLKRGCIADFELIMKHQLGIYNEEYWSATNFKYTFPNGSYIEFVGLEDEGKAHGPRRDYLFINEANLIRKALFDQLAMRTAKTIIIDLNPSDFNCWCYEVADNPKNLKLHSTYLDNIENLTPNQISYIESYKNLPDDFMWKVYGLGERGAAKELIFPRWFKCAALPNKGEVVYGIDFGFTNPTAMVKVEMYENDIYAEEVLYQAGLTTAELCEYIKTLNFGYAPIYCDSAEPKTIEALAQYGFNVHASNKDVWAGIMALKAHKIYVTEKSINLQSEMSGYKWRTDRDGNILEEPVKMKDHLCDALRYSVHTHFSGLKSQFFML